MKLCRFVSLSEISRHLSHRPFINQRAYPRHVPMRAAANGNIADENMGRLISHAREAEINGRYRLVIMVDGVVKRNKADIIGDAHAREFKPQVNFFCHCVTRKMGRRQILKYCGTQRQGRGCFIALSRNRDKALMHPRPSFLVHKELCIGIGMLALFAHDHMNPRRRFA